MIQFSIIEFIWPQKFIREIKEGESYCWAFISYKRFPIGYNPYTKSYYYKYYDPSPFPLSHGNGDECIPDETVPRYIWRIGITVPLPFCSLFIKYEKTYATLRNN